VLLADLPISRFLTSTAPLVNWDAALSGEAFVFVEVDRDRSALARIDVVLGWGQHLEGAGSSPVEGSD
jgi:hypothetical protein